MSLSAMVHKICKIKMYSCLVHRIRRFRVWCIHRRAQVAIMGVLYMSIRNLPRIVSVENLVYKTQPIDMATKPVKPLGTFLFSF
eukprot:jgi/Botrbrau1/1673/Bobra.116_2s0017.1